MSASDAYDIAIPSMRVSCTLATTCVFEAQKVNGVAVITKDISWLWRTAYNTAVQGCAEWENSEGQVADLFEAAYDVSTSCHQPQALELDLRYSP